MTKEEAIKDFELQNILLREMRTTASLETYERNLMAIEALKAQNEAKLKMGNVYGKSCYIDTDSAKEGDNA